MVHDRSYTISSHTANTCCSHMPFDMANLQCKGHPQVIATIILGVICVKDLKDTCDLGCMME